MDPSGAAAACHDPGAFFLKGGPLLAPRYIYPCWPLGLTYDRRLNPLFILIAAYLQVELHLGVKFEDLRPKTLSLMLVHLVASNEQAPLYSVMLLSVVPTNSVRVRLMLPAELCSALRALSGEESPGGAAAAARLTEGARAYFQQELRLQGVGPGWAPEDPEFWTLAPEAGWSLETLLRGAVAAGQREHFHSVAEDFLSRRE